tara:strand:- start:370 stop:543 length:174 start_codon:yes stop_codon:yes gene_type:complete
MARQLKLNIMTTEIQKIQIALKKQKNRTCSIDDLNYLKRKFNQYGTLNIIEIKYMIQ